MLINSIEVFIIVPLVLFLCPLLAAFSLHPVAVLAHGSDHINHHGLLPARRILLVEVTHQVLAQISMLALTLEHLPCKHRCCRNGYGFTYIKSRF